MSVLPEQSDFTRADDRNRSSLGIQTVPVQGTNGRCLVAYKDHVHDLNMLSDEERNAFMADVVRVTRAMQKVFNPQKINYGAYSDKLSHLHFHLAPKYEGGPDFGGTFTMNPQKVYLTDAEYQDMVEKIKEAL